MASLTAPEALYLDLLKRCLTRTGFEEAGALASWDGLDLAVRPVVRDWLDTEELRVVQRSAPTPELRVDGRDWPATAETMIGWKRLQSLQDCVVDVIRSRVPGDLIETGAWRGGAAILMRGVLAAFAERDRLVWVADSFEGLPKPDPERFPADAGDQHWAQPALAVSLEEVQRNFERYGLLDDQVRFLQGWFSETLHRAPIEQLAILRLDGDMYQSTFEALDALYGSVARGGYVIVDDYGAVAGCRAAVDDFREQHKITDPIRPIDWTGVLWQRGV